jgi:beta-lactamase superfamily II metal-dependent hydrolase
MAKRVATRKNAGTRSKAKRRASTVTAKKKPTRVRKTASTARTRPARRTRAAPAKKQPARSRKPAKSFSSRRASAGAADNGLRVRMYRVGFGDFFLLTVPTASAGPQHLLIDCGVHAGNIKSMPDCVADLIAVTQRKLALVIVTHYHADHLSGFATHYDEFAQFEVGAVWITNRLDPSDAQSMAFKSQLSLLSDHLRLQLQLRLAAGEDVAARQALAKVENALGVGFGVAGSGNEKALDLVTDGFSNHPPVHYYEAGDEPALPSALQGAITAEILGPSPKASEGDFAASDNKTEQYLAAVSVRGLTDTNSFKPFDRDWPASASDYPAEAFRPWPGSRDMEKALHAVQPDVLAAAADLVDGTLNNQSLVVLFTCRRKKLLFVGDAQWGNWAYWLYGRGVKGKDPGISERARQILGDIDFYKVGHHGSTNATPIPAVGAMPDTCVAMCSTETGYPSDKRTYGSIKKKTEVPRIALMEALEEQTGDKLVRSDWIAVEGKAPASPEAHEQLEKLPPNFVAGEIYVDYIFPA